MPKVSVAMPVYNCEKYVAQSLESLLNQTFEDLELVISDNASTDGTEEVCRRFARMDSRVRYIRRTENIGGPGNFRFVFSRCAGEYHKWSTADDYWHPAFLEEAVTVLNEKPDVVLCYPKTRLVGPNGETLSDYNDVLHLVDASPRVRFRDLYRLIGLCNAQLGLIRRNAMLKTRLMARHHASDTDFLGELALLGKFWLLPNVRFFRRFHPDASSWARTDSERQRKYYEPNLKIGLGMQTWRRILFQYGMVWRSPVGFADKLALTVDVGRWSRYERHALLRELTDRVLPRVPPN